MNDQEKSVPLLLWNLSRLAGVQRESVDNVALQAAVDSAVTMHPSNNKGQVQRVCEVLQLKKPRFLSRMDAAALPLLACSPDGQWLVIRSQNGKGQWVGDVLELSGRKWQELVVDIDKSWLLVKVNLALPLSVRDSPLLQSVMHELKSQRLLLTEAIVSGALMAILALMTSLYSMQVYDRVIPTGGYQTLLVLTLGVFIAILFEFGLKRVRSHVYDQLVDRVDAKLARMVYARFLSVRLDQLPQSVGSMAGQLRGYESVRSFMVSLFTQYLVDVPFALLFALVLAAIAGWLALIPLLFLVFSFAVGFYFKSKIHLLSLQSQALSNQKIT